MSPQIIINHAVSYHFSPWSLLLFRCKSKSSFNNRVPTDLPVSILVPLPFILHTAARVNFCNRIISCHYTCLKSPKGNPSHSKLKCAMFPAGIYGILLPTSLTWSPPLSPSIGIWPPWLSFCPLHQLSLFLPWPSALAMSWPRLHLSPDLCITSSSSLFSA